MSEAVDLVIRARWVVPVEPAGLVLDHHAVAVRDGRPVYLQDVAAVKFGADQPEQYVTFGAGLAGPRQLSHVVKFLDRPIT